MNEEEILGKAYDTRLMKRLLRYLKPYRWHVVIGIGLSVIVAGMEAVRPWFTQHAVDVNIKQGDKTGLLITAVVFFLVLILRGLIQYANTYLTQWVGQKAIFDLRMEVFKHLQGLGLKFFDRNPIGRLVTRVTNDIEVLNEMFASGIVMVFSDVFTIAGIVWFMFSMNWELALISLSVVPILFYGTFLFRKKARETYRDVRLHLARINTFMQEHITGMMVDQIFNREKKSYHKFSGINADLRDAHVRSIFYYALFYPGIDLVGAVAIGLLLWYAGLDSLGGNITVGTVMAFLQFNEMFWRPIRDLSEKYNIMQTAMASSERVFKLLDDNTKVEYTVPIDDSRLKVHNSQLAPQAHPPLADTTHDSPFKGRIEFKNVWFAYDKEDWVLKNVTLKIEPGETVAIVGHTGAGKTTITNLLCRFYEFQRGEILVDGIDIRLFNKEDLRKHIAIVLQDVFLFSGDIKTNITLGNEEISSDRMKAAARVVGAHRFIEALPNQYDAEVKERGSTLSVGQKQLISFARALAVHPKILILDEATSSVDTETEILIQQAIRKLLQGRTSIVVAHRLSTIQRANKIIVMHKGEIREMGTHQELLVLGGIYYKLYQLQYKEQEKLTTDIH
ncbi:MAG: ABC transporter ATP-binding protein [Ignavibacteriae bacterium]|nr:ABC transporter ATP-binding protein [Ignavibacteriota bacterium]